MKYFGLLAATVFVAALVAGCGSSGPKLYDPGAGASGLEFRDLVVGGGARPDGDDAVVVHYTGWLTNGQMIETSSGGDPFEFSQGFEQVIDGWEEGVRTMRVGGKRRLTIPPNLAYGALGNAQLGVPSNATLIYDLELVEVKRLDWVLTASGIKYTDLETGLGDLPQDGQRCYVKYTGWLTDGTMFDTSDNSEAGEFSFVLGAGQVIRGWDEGVATMTIGSTRRMVIPPDLAYGAEGRPPKIPGSSTLIFEVELLRVE